MAVRYEAELNHVVHVGNYGHFDHLTPRSGGILGRTIVALWGKRLAFWVGMLIAMRWLQAPGSSPLRGTPQGRPRRTRTQKESCSTLEDLDGGCMRRSELGQRYRNEQLPGAVHLTPCPATNIGPPEIPALDICWCSSTSTIRCGLVMAFGKTINLGSLHLVRTSRAARAVPCTSSRSGTTTRPTA